MITKYLPLFLFTSLSLACQQLRPQEKIAATVPQPATFYQTLANQSSAPNLDSTRDGIVLHNDDFPIEVKLYEDHTFYYLLPTLGDGKGTWQYQDGHINLHAKRTLFDMSIDVYSLAADSEKLAFSFADRHGWQFIDVAVNRY